MPCIDIATGVWLAFSVSIPTTYEIAEKLVVVCNLLWGSLPLWCLYFLSHSG